MCTAVGAAFVDASACLQQPEPCHVPPAAALPSRPIQVRCLPCSPLQNLGKDETKGTKAGERQEKAERMRINPGAKSRLRQVGKAGAGSRTGNRLSLAGLHGPLHLWGGCEVLRRGAMPAQPVRPPHSRR